MLWWFRKLLHDEDVVQSGPFTVTCFIVANPSWEIRDPLQVRFLDQVRYWCDNQDAPLNDYFMWLTAVSTLSTDLRKEAILEWARVTLVVKFLQWFCLSVLQPSMFTRINRSLGLPFIEQVAVWEVGESDTYKTKFLAVWSASVIS